MENGLLLITEYMSNERGSYHIFFVLAMCKFVMCILADAVVVIHKMCQYATISVSTNKTFFPKTKDFTNHQLPHSIETLTTACLLAGNPSSFGCCLT